MPHDCKPIASVVSQTCRTATVKLHDAQVVGITIYDLGSTIEPCMCTHVFVNSQLRRDSNPEGVVYQGGVNNLLDGMRFINLMYMFFI